MRQWIKEKWVNVSLCYYLLVMFVCTCIRIIVISYIKYTEVYLKFVIFKWLYTLVHIFQSD